MYVDLAKIVYLKCFITFWLILPLKYCLLSPLCGNTTFNSYQFCLLIYICNHYFIFTNRKITVSGKIFIIVHEECFGKNNICSPHMTLHNSTQLRITNCYNSISCIEWNNCRIMSARI